MLQAEKIIFQGSELKTGKFMLGIGGEAPVPEERMAICTPRIPIASFPANLKPDAALGFAILYRDGQERPEQESYLKYIRTQHSRLYALAEHHRKVTAVREPLRW